VETSLVIVDSGGLQPSVDDSYLAVDGYGYYSDGINPSVNLDDYTLRVKDGEDVRIAVPNGEIADSYKVYIGAGTSTVPITATVISQEKLEYVTLSQTSVISKVELLLAAAVVQTITVENIEACIETAKEVKYYDRNGALSITYMFGRGITSLKSKRDDYRQDVGFMSTAYSYDSSKHQKRTFDVSANESLVLNSGFVPEDQNEIFKQIILSELVWVDDKPVNVKDSSFTYKTNKQDKLINYTLNLDYAYSEIQNVY